MPCMATTQPEHAPPPPERATAPPAAWERGTCIRGRFTIERLLGSGGMGEVYEAHDTELRRSVAIKVLRRPIGDAAAEATILAQLDHPNVLTIHEYIPGSPALLVMALVRGTPLDRYLSARRLSPDVFFTVARQIAAGLAACHEQGVLHRDLKPGNILLVERADDLHAILIDFGIAAMRRRRERDTSTFKVSPVHSGEIWGSRLYMAPEQWDGADLTPAADVYGLGCVLFEMLTGTPPFPDRPDLQEQHRSARRPVPSRRAAWVPPALDALLAGMLAADPTHRPADARAVLTRLVAVAGLPRTPHRRLPAALVTGAVVLIGSASFAFTTNPGRDAEELTARVLARPPDDPESPQPTPRRIPQHLAVLTAAPTPAPVIRRTAPPTVRPPKPPPPVIPVDRIVRSAEAVLSANSRATIAFGTDQAITVRDDNLMADTTRMLTEQLTTFAAQAPGLILRCNHGRCTPQTPEAP
jgi:eukaryotic-like serine/threonine-protein kinase